MRHIFTSTAKSIAWQQIHLLNADDSIKQLHFYQKVTIAKHICMNIFRTHPHMSGIFGVYSSAYDYLCYLESIVNEPPIFDEHQCVYGFNQHNNEEMVGYWSNKAKGIAPIHESLGTGRIIFDYYLPCPNPISTYMY